MPLRRSPTGRRLAALVAVAAVALLLPLPAGAVDRAGEATGVRRAGSGTATTRTPSAVPTPPTGGTTRVIVDLATDTEPEAARTERGVRRQRRAIDRAAAAVADDLAATEGRVVHRFESVPGMVVEADAEALDALEASPLVEAVTVDREARTLLDQSVAQVRADAAWAGGDGTGQQVAIVDTGVDNAHPHLAGAVVYEACTVDDCPAADGTPGAAAPCNESNCDHGTHVAGIAAGHDPGDHAGVAKGAEIVAVQVFHDNAGLEEATAFFGDIVAALDLLHDKVDDGTLPDLAAVNLSLGAGLYPAFCDVESPSMVAAVQNLKDLGVATVAASGNNGAVNGISFPACLSEVVSVGNVTTPEYEEGADRIWITSNASPVLDLLAPGAQIDAALAGTSGTTKKSGTSMAAPHVAGAFAVLRANGVGPPGGLDQDVVDHLHGILRTNAGSGSSDCITDPGNGRKYRRIDVKDAVDWSGVPSARYWDVTPCSFFEPAIDWLAFDPDGSGGPDGALASGYPDGGFKPKRDITRGQVANMVWILFGSQPSGHVPPFGDVPNWLEGAVAWMNDPAGPATPDPLMSGYPDDTFRDEEDITRGQVARMLYRAAGAPDPLHASCTPHGFSDVPDWVDDAVAWLTCDHYGPGGTESIANGYPGGLFKPSDPISREEVARMLFQYEVAGHVT